MRGKKEKIFVIVNQQDFKETINHIVATNLFYLNVNTHFNVKIYIHIYIYTHTINYNIN